MNAKKKVTHSLGTLLMAGLLSLQSCTHDDHATDKADIGFATDVSATRTQTGLMATVAAFETAGNTFGVFGYKSNNEFGSSSSTPIFINQEVTYTTGWSYRPLRYWDRGCNYQFIAYAPYTNNGTPVDGMEATADVTGGNLRLTLTGVPGFQRLPEGYDLLASSSVWRNKLNTSAVALTFNHILSRINVAFKLERQPSASYRAEMKWVALSGMPQSGTYSRAHGLSNDTEGWTEISTHAVADTLGSGRLQLLDTTYQPFADTALVIPTTFSTAAGQGPQLTFGYQLTMGGSTGEVQGHIDLSGTLRQLIAGRGATLSVVLAVHDEDLQDFDQLNPNAQATWWTVVDNHP